MSGPDVVEQAPPRRMPAVALGVAAVAAGFLAVVVARGGGGEPRPSPTPVATSPTPSAGTEFFTIPGRHGVTDDGVDLVLRVGLTSAWPDVFEVVVVTPLDRFGEPARNATAALVDGTGDLEASEKTFTVGPEPVTVAPGAAATLLLRVTGCSPVTAVRLDVRAGDHRRTQLVALTAVAPGAAATLSARCQPTDGPPL